MDKFFKIKCPICKSILIIDRFSGKIEETRKPLVKETTGDRFQDAFKKLQDDKAQAEGKFQKLANEEKNKKKKINDIFKQQMDKVKKEGVVEKEIRDIDLD